MVKTITIRDEVYHKLIGLKQKDESFSELFDRLAEGQDSKQVLTKLHSSVQFEQEEKEQLLTDIINKRAARRR
jgi:predicted CopG family antitoxin